MKKIKYQKNFSNYKDYINQLNEILSLLDLICEGKKYKKLNKWYNNYNINRYYINKTFDNNNYTTIGQLDYKEKENQFIINFKLKDDKKIIKMINKILN